jgi:hypothetical protein
MLTGKRLSTLMKDRRAEVDKANRWLEKNARKLPKEELPRERVLDAEGKPVARVISLPEGADNWHVVYGEIEGGRSYGGEASTGWRHDQPAGPRPKKSRFVPLQGGSQVIDLYDATITSIVRKVLADLPKKHRDLLQAYYLEGKSLRKLARKGEARQTVAERVEWARIAFERAWLRRSSEPVVLTEEDF